MTDAAEIVLRSSMRPLTITEIAERINKRDLWRPPNGGQTPLKTLGTALRREIRESAKPRFRLEAPGLFAAAGKGRA